MTPEQQAAMWNEKYPVGIAVLYWRGAKQGPGKQSSTKSQAEVLGGHTAVIWVEGEPGCIALSHVNVMGETRG